MKICLISNLYEPYNRGGAEQVVKDTINGLKNKGEDIFLITIEPFKNLSSLKPKLTEENGVKIYRFYPLNIFSYINIDKHNVLLRFFWRLLDIFNVYSYFAIKKILQQEMPDVVHTHNLSGIGYLIPKAVKKLKIKHIHTLHDIQLASPSGLMIKGKENNWQQTGFPTKAYFFVCKYLFNAPQIIISPSKWLMDYYNQKGFFKKSQKVILRNPINPSFKKLINRRGISIYPFNPPLIPPREGNMNVPPPAEGARGRVSNAPLGLINFLFIGQIEYHKGALFLVDAFNSLGDLNMKLDIIGDGSLLEEVKKRAKDNINFFGKISHENVLEKLKATDFLIIPSLCYENSPNVVSEALSAGKPVIVADIGGCAELIDDNGYKFEAGNKEDLINKIKLAAKNISNFNPSEIKNTIDQLAVGDYTEKLINLYNR